MKYRIKHITTYKYPHEVSQCYNLGYLIPRTSQRQTMQRHTVKVDPYPASSNKRKDYFGNTVFHFEVQTPHKQLTITAESDVITEPQSGVSGLDLGMTYGEAREMLERSSDPDVLLAREYLLESPMIRQIPELQDYASPSFEKSRPLYSIVSELTTRIFEDFTYDPESTTVSTPIADVIKNRRGVCQDFAHLQVGCLRAMGIPAKYVSGYLETLPPPGQQKLVGSDATHAWISYYSPGESWYEFDPTNNKPSADQHIIAAWGRDYADVTPVRGVIFGGGDAPRLTVSVDVARV